LDRVKGGGIFTKKFILAYVLGLLVVLFFWDKTRIMEEVSSFFGFAAAMFFIAANAYYPAKLIARKFNPLPQAVVLFFKKYLAAHIWMNEVAFLALVIHCRYSEAGNIFLTGCYIVTVVLTVEGLVMYYRMVPGSQRLLRMLHTQQTLFVVWVVLIVLGHSID
jgi:hypothetical protein